MISDVAHTGQVYGFYNKKEEFLSRTRVLKVDIEWEGALSQSYDTVRK